jgi:hypothetical protein
MSTQRNDTDISTFVKDEYIKAEIAIKRLDNLSSEIIDIRHRMANVVENYHSDPNKDALHNLIQDEKDTLFDFNEVLGVALGACYNLMLSATEMHSAYLIMSNAIINLTKQTEKE